LTKDWGNPAFLEEKFSVFRKRKTGRREKGWIPRAREDILWRNGNDRGDMNDIKGK